MTKKINIIMLKILGIATLIYSIHKLVFYYNSTIKNFNTPIEKTYIFFAISSFLIVSVVSFVKRISIENAGFSFIIATFLKIIISYFILYPTINYGNIRVEKINFFLIFAIFSAIETFFSAKILNQPIKKE